MNNKTLKYKFQHSIFYKHARLRKIRLWKAARSEILPLIRTLRVQRDMLRVKDEVLNAKQAQIQELIQGVRDSVRDVLPASQHHEFELALNQFEKANSPDVLAKEGELAMRRGIWLLMKANRKSHFKFLNNAL